ncbi:hypothetical protein vseg_004073 [Gypsophila vaccaria]
MTEDTTRASRPSTNFAKTCNRFSQFLKERRCLGDRVRFSSGFVSETLEMEGNREEKKSLDLFPMTSSTSSTIRIEESTDNVVFSRESIIPNEEANNEITRGSMTIIYDGKVVVFDGLNEEMAQEIMSLVTTQQNVANTTQHDTFRHNNNMTTRLSVFPIARGASLHRFMEKRKHRINASGPYQVNNLSSRKRLYKEQEEHQLELKL